MIGLLPPVAVGLTNRAGIGEDLVSEHVAAGRLVPVLTDWSPPFSGYHLYYASRRQPSPSLPRLSGIGANSSSERLIRGSRLAPADVIEHVLDGAVRLSRTQDGAATKGRLGSITKQENRYLRQLLVVGSLAVVRYAQRKGSRRPWLVQLLARRTTKGVRVS